MPPRDKKQTEKVLSGQGDALFIPTSSIAQPIAVGDGGPSVRMVSSERAMKPLTIFETEILAITRASALSSIAFSFSAGLASYAFQEYFEMETPKIAGIAGSVMLSLICALVGVWANNWRHEVITQIRKESGDVPPTFNIMRTIFGKD